MLLNKKYSLILLFTNLPLQSYHVFVLCTSCCSNQAKFLVVLFYACCHMPVTRKHNFSFCGQYVLYVLLVFPYDVTCCWLSCFMYSCNSSIVITITVCIVVTHTHTCAHTHTHTHARTHAHTHTHTHTHTQTNTQDEDDELTPGYKAPAQVDLKTIQDMDADDESLVKYKQQLLGATSNVLGAVIIFNMH